MASDRVVEEIKQRLDLVEYIGRTVDLKRAGRTYKACCPFHAEKTPSFIVFPHTGTWRCFGACGDGGDIFTYTQKREGLVFGEALRLLAREAGVALEEETDSQRQARDEREHLLTICEAAAQQFQTWLRDLPEAAHCRAYVERRALSAETVHRFGLGYAPNAWDALLSALTTRGYTAQDLARVGLAKERDNGGYYDALRDRLIFPIRDVRGRVIGFGGRALQDDQMPKYLNSPQTVLFDKSRTLYAIDLAKDPIRTRERAVLVEGYMDAIAAHQAGYANVVASLGTSLTSEQVKLLSRFSPNITLALDADTAGQKAAERGLDVVLDLQREVRRARWDRAKQGQGKASDAEGEIRVLTLPEGMDPDDLIRKQPQQWERLVADAKPVMDYLIGQRLRATDLDDPVQKARVAADLLPLVAEIDSSIVRDHYLQQLARLLHADERTLAQEMAQVARRAIPKRLRAEPSPEPPPPPLDGAAWDEPPPDLLDMDDEAWLLEAPPLDSTAAPEEGAEPLSLEAYLLYLFLERPPLLAHALERGLTAAMWQQTEHREIFAALAHDGPQSAAHLEEFAQRLDAPVARQLRRIVSFYAARPPLTSEDWEIETRERLEHFLITYEERQARELHYLIDDIQRGPETDSEALQELQRQQLAVQRSILRRQRALRERAKVTNGRSARRD
ncbi:MAG TPA: DNA primase [Ardenticatenaceae bacterium]|jgi:DNA primase